MHKRVLVHVLGAASLGLLVGCAGAIIPDGGVPLGERSEISVGGVSYPVTRQFSSRENQSIYYVHIDGRPYRCGTSSQDCTAVVAQHSRAAQPAPAPAPSAAPPAAPGK